VSVDKVTIGRVSCTVGFYCIFLNTIILPISDFDICFPVCNIKLIILVNSVVKIKFSLLCIIYMIWSSSKSQLGALFIFICVTTSVNLFSLIDSIGPTIHFCLPV